MVAPKTFREGTQGVTLDKSRKKPKHTPQWLSSIHALNPFEHKTFQTYKQVPFRRNKHFHWMHSTGRKLSKSRAIAWAKQIHRQILTCPVVQVSTDMRFRQKTHIFRCLPPCFPSEFTQQNDFSLDDATLS